MMLEKLGCKGIPVFTGADGIKVAAERTPDLILIDIHLPDITGFHALKEIRENPSSQDCRCMMMSVDTSEESVILGISSGADGFITKPIKLQELGLKVSSLLNLPISHERLKTINSNLREEDATFASHFSKDTLSYMFNSDRGQATNAIYTFSSVLVVHFQGMNAMVDDMDSESMQNIVNTLTSDISTIIYKNRGSINHFIGETIMATFGTPVVYDNDTINALLCAEEIAEYGRIMKDNAVKEAKNIKLCIGITSGKVFSGTLSSATHKLSHAVLGEPIRIARIMDVDLRKIDRDIIIDEATKEVVGPYIEYTPIQIDGNQNIGNFYVVEGVDMDQISQIPNLAKQYTPKDQVSDEGYTKL